MLPVKRILKLFFLVLALGAIVAFGWHHYSQWQFARDKAEAALAPQGKLPTTMEPRHYALSLRIDPDEKRFSGAVAITVDIHRETDIIWLHGENINPHSVTLEHPDGSQTPLEYQEMGHSGVVRLQAQEQIPAQTAIIVIRFDAPFNSKLVGLYKVEEGGLNYAFTQFEPARARQVFPQFDEPRFKIPYDISLEIPQQLRGFGNTPVIKEEDVGDGFKRLTLATTKPLPSYLLAFAVGELDVVEYAPIPATHIRKKPLPLRGIAAKGKGEQLAYALKHTAALLTTLEEYFGTPYPFAKLDIVAVPDFASGAMENAGLITYRETLLLFDTEPSVSQQRRYANVHAHELAHQWFGNLVTMPWWDDIWLNESFATWMASKAVQQWNPGLEADREIVRRGHRVMGSDIYTDSRRVREPVENNEGIANAFDGISYSKGGAVLQMLESTITPAIFQQGIQNYLQQHAWGNATALDLIQALAAAAQSLQIADIAGSFINQPGVPLLTVDWQCDSNQLTLDIQQQRYLPAGSTVSPEQEWIVPVCMTAVNGMNKANICQTLTDAQQRFTHAVEQCPDAIMPNLGGHGYYRWTMAQPLWRGLLNNVSSLTPGEKYSVASNLAAQYRAAHIDTQFYLQAVNAIIAQPEWDVRTEPAALIRHIRDNIADEQQRGQLADYLYDQYKPLLDELGLEPDTNADALNPVATQLLRSRVLSLIAIDLQQPELLALLAERGKALIGYGQDTGFDASAIDPQLHSLAMASAVIAEGAPYFEQLMSMVYDSDQANFRRNALWALGQTTDPGLGKKVLSVRQLFKLKLNDMQLLIQSYSSKAENTQVAFDWFKRFYPLAALVIPEAYLASTPSLAGELCSPAAHADAQAFFGPKVERVTGMERNLSQNLEQIQLCYALVEAQRELGWGDG
ncbi:MAG: alanyl aminopeptidase [Bacteroidia bacterium]|jgi:alanyl aminopeptidase